MCFCTETWHHNPASRQTPKGISQLFSWYSGPETSHIWFGIPTASDWLLSHPFDETRLFFFLSFSLQMGLHEIKSSFCRTMPKCGNRNGSVLKVSPLSPSQTSLSTPFLLFNLSRSSAGSHWPKFRGTRCLSVHEGGGGWVCGCLLKNITPQRATSVHSLFCALAVFPCLVERSDKPAPLLC